MDIDHGHGVCIQEICSKIPSNLIVCVKHNNFFFVHVQISFNTQDSTNDGENSVRNALCIAAKPNKRKIHATCSTLNIICLQRKEAPSFTIKCKVILFFPLKIKAMAERRALARIEKHCVCVQTEDGLINVYTCIYIHSNTQCGTGTHIIFLRTLAYAVYVGEHKKKRKKSPSLIVNKGCLFLFDLFSLASLQEPNRWNAAYLVNK